MDLEFIYLEVASATIYTNSQTYSLGQTLASTKASEGYSSLEILLQYAADSEQLTTYLQRFKTEQQLRKHLRQQCNGRYSSLLDYHLAILTTFELTFERDCGRRFKPQARKRIYRAIQLLPLTIDTRLSGVESVLHMNPSMKSWVVENSGDLIRLRTTKPTVHRPASFAEEVFEDVQEDSLQSFSTVHQMESAKVVAVEENFVSISLPDVRADLVPSLTESEEEGEICVTCPRLIRRTISARQLRASLAQRRNPTWAREPIVRHARRRGLSPILLMYSEPKWGRVSNSEPVSTLVARIRAVFQRAYAWARRSSRRRI